jgi:dienelactone hydrolase
MAEVVLFHHALGLTLGVVAFADELRRAGHTESADAELFLYPGDQHYFADSTLTSYDPAAAALLTERVLAFLAAR